MKHVGIICELNPLHAGHARLLRAVGEAQTVVALMSGAFVQRGEAAILPPSLRAAMAIESGADLVLELPYPFAAASARYFATAGVRALAALGVDTLAFGSEDGSAERLAALADRAGEDHLDRIAANGAQNVGDARAYFQALGAEVGSNDILGVEYLRAIGKHAAGMEAFVIKREGAAYGEEALLEGALPSATAMRAALRSGMDVSGLLPPEALPILREGVANYGLADTTRLGAPLLAMLRHPDAERLFANAAECGGGLLGRLIRAAQGATDYHTLLSLAATKRYTNARIRRALLFLLTGVTREDLLAPPAYLTLLAANERGVRFLSQTRRSRTVPVVTKEKEIKALGAGAERAHRLAEAAKGAFSLCMASPTAQSEWNRPPYLKKGT